MNLIFSISGGLGKSILSTAVISALKKKHQDANIIVITAFPDVFFNNPNVYKVYSNDKLEYFYRDNIDKKQVLTFLQEPYLESSFINKENHLLETWFNLCGLKYSGEKPELFLTHRELSAYSKKYLSVKPIFVIQSNGGAEGQDLKYSWARDIPVKTAQKIVDHFADEYTIYHIRRPDQFSLNNTIPINDNFRSICTLIGMSNKRLFIDSFAQHAASALSQKSVVCWIVNDSTQFGYDNNINIQSNIPTVKTDLRDSIFSKYNILGSPVEFPFNNEEEIFNVDNIINALNNA